MPYCSWDIVHDVSNCYFSFWAIFCPFTPPPPNSPRNENSKKKKRKRKKPTCRYFHLHKHTKNHDHILYCSWDMAHDGCNYFSYWAIFCPFSPLTAQEIKIKKNNEKKHLEILSFYTEILPFYTIVPKIMIIYCTEISHMTDVIVIFHFGLFFTLLPS